MQERKCGCGATSVLAERLWPNPERRWEAVGGGGGGYLYHAPVDQERSDE